MGKSPLCLSVVSFPKFHYNDLLPTCWQLPRLRGSYGETCVMVFGRYQSRYIALESKRDNDPQFVTVTQFTCRARLIAGSRVSNSSRFTSSINRISDVQIHRLTAAYVRHALSVIYRADTRVGYLCTVERSFTWRR